ncbi:MAG: hypothetical protein EHM36_01655 [Deltaproteobacteria bacterium]|nr:MAG: hypothetical protein EHM36_01655 [Deltaproteobacteria bacterium]
MTREMKCPLYRKSEGLSFGKGVGYCDIDSGSTTCDGDVSFCSTPEALKRYIRNRLEDLERVAKE